MLFACACFHGPWLLKRHTRDVVGRALPQEANALFVSKRSKVSSFKIGRSVPKGPAALLPPSAEGQGLLAEGAASPHDL